MSKKRVILQIFQNEFFCGIFSIEDIFRFLEDILLSF